MSVHRRSVWLILCLSLLIGLAELWLLQHKYHLLSGGGFLQPHSYQSFGQRAVFLMAAWYADLCLLLLLFLLYNLLLKFRTSEQSHLWFGLILAGCWTLYCWSNARLYDYFGDNLDWQVLANLGGGSAWQALQLVLEEIGQQFVPLLVALLLVVLLLYGLHRQFRRWRRPVADGRSWLWPTAVVLLLLPVQLSFIASQQPYQFGLQHKLSQQLLSALLNKATDVDLDGFGAFGTADPAPWDAALYPGAMDIPANGVDEDDLAGDLAPLPARIADPLKMLPLRAGRHIVLVVLESVRADMLFAREDGRAVMPTLAALARQGSYSEHAYSHTGFTTSSLKAIFNGSLSNHPPGQNLLDALEQRGYQLNVLSAQAERFGDVASAARLKRPGLYYFDAESALADRLEHSLNPGALRLSEQRLLRQLQQRFNEVDWRRPQFFYVNIQAAHYPYHHREMPAVFSDQPVRRSEMKPANRLQIWRSYVNAVAHADQAVGQLLQLLQRQRPLSDIQLLVTSDHGESLFDDGFLGHGHQLNDTQTRVLAVSNQPMSFPPVWGHTVLGPVLLAGALQQPLPRLPSFVLQLVGLVRSPQQLALTDHNGRLLYDFRQQHFLLDGRWLDFNELSAAHQQRARTMIRQWGWLRYQQSVLYQRQQHPPAGGAGQ